MKNRIIEKAEEVREELLRLSHDIHSHPETSYQEFRAAAWQKELLERHGFAVEMPFCGMETAFRAVKKGKGPGAVVAFLSEYDALNGLGHACGHNIIAAASVGAGLSLASVLENVPGEVQVIGTPAEEGGGGKIFLVEHGAFESVDFALMMHPSTKNIIGRGGLAAREFRVEFRGKAAHSATPDKGVNALTSLIAFFNGIDTLRQTWPDSAKINGIITKGGEASNIIPEVTEAVYTVRASTKKELLPMCEDLKRMAEAAALVTGASFTVHQTPIYAERYPNSVMGEAFKRNMEFLGEQMEYPDPKERVGSSDVGNVSLEIPAIHEYLAIADPSVAGHTPEFREAAVSPRSDKVVILAAKGLALTGLDLLTDEILREAAKVEYREKAFPYRS